MIRLTHKLAAFTVRAGVSVIVLSVFVPPDFVRDCDRAFAATRQSLASATARAGTDYAALHRVLR